MNLNDAQIEATFHVNGPLLILAGAGSGKTRVLTERIANLIARENVPPYNILSVTFTNKAAKEMKERISKRIGEADTKNIWMGTFHSICSRMLRTDMVLLGRKSNFVIYDNADQTKILNDCIKLANLDKETYQANKIISIISKSKSAGVNAEEYLKTHVTYSEQKIGELYMMYDQTLKKNNALDFDDMLFYVVQILKENPDRLAYYQNKFRYILVDEYQDTNQIQYDLIKLLAAMHQNICVVGDVDQSIYSFRNADFRIILNFQKDYSDVKVIKLEKNYRSTKNILAISNEIISENKERFDKRLSTDNEKGENIFLYELSNEKREVVFIMGEIENLVINKDFKYNDITILYRTNAQSRIFEEYFIQNNIPHQILGGYRFFERKEIKDILSYLKVVFNPSDAVNLQRVINIPKRGIGNTTIEKLSNTADTFNMTFWDVLNFQNFENISPATQKSIRAFTQIMNSLIKESESISVSRLIRMIIEESGYLDELQKEANNKTEEDQSRLENVYQLINSAVNFETDSDDVSLEAYLNYISLISDIDSMEGETSNKVRLMTVHTSKGLEFPVVFLAGTAEGIFPHFNSSKNNEIEEERRLMYVAMTRAKKLLYLTFARERMQYGSYQHLTPSRFVGEIKSDHLVSAYKDIEQSNRGFESTRLRFVQKSLSEYSKEIKRRTSGITDFKDPYEYKEPQKYQKKNDYSFSEVDQDYQPSLLRKSSDSDYEKRKPKKLDNLAIQSSLEKRYSENNVKPKPGEYKEGQRVQTAKWGKGTINKVMKNKEKIILIINFDSVGGSKIIDPNLTVIEHA